MGRSRGNFHAEEDPSQRSRRKKNASNGENLDYITAGQGSGEGKPASYHCNYCNKDITGRIRIKCAVCSDFDLCIECFSVGAEVQPHKSNHPYRVMDILSFPLICPDWNADEEMLLLEGIEMYGIGKWAEVGEHVGTKTKDACIEHYRSAYLNSPYFPLPDMTHVVGRNREELLAMSKDNGEDKKGFFSLGELARKNESPFSPSRVKVEDSNRSGSSGRLTSASNTGTTGIKKPSKKVLAKDQTDSVKLEDNVSALNFGSKKPKLSKDEGPSLMEISGYNQKRHEFDPEYDNDAELLLADMEFKDADTEEERELKLRVLRIYSKRLDERKRRKDFIIGRNLLYPTEFEKTLSQEEKDLWRRYDAFMRFHSREEHEELLKAIILEHRTVKRIKELKEARAAGCRSSAEADRYFEQKRKREVEENGPKKENYHAGPSIQDSLSSLGTHSNKRSSSLANLSSLTDLEFAAHSAIELLSEPEKQLCRDIRMPPPHYLKMLELMTVHIYSGDITKKSDAYTFFQIETTKVDRVYDMLLKKGIAPL
ncbi:transcriptional adapter ADA2b [Ipomoea triloba]|uniref:transcriptional adapter ADA2b n=1 Tax=Ipomoea triloba TaxID=35885 RepID=UPI00125DFA28|nr:transcriptional adapter ADA2b [Ipomoea triloba]